jgi:menaquinol-cytochrome c reductase iron-sulfur subunit
MNAPARIASRDDSRAEQVREKRRGFLTKLLAISLGAFAYAVPVAAGVISFLNPWRQKSQAGRFLRLASLETLPEDGTPRKFPVVMDRVDAWNRFPKEPVGAVFLRRVEGGVRALHVVCPHAGCFVGYDAEKKHYLCPCHNGEFALDGTRLGDNSPSPRDLDALDVEIRDDTEVWVKYENYRTGIPQKVAEA